MRRKDLGIYIHIPFCIRKCLYCDFCSMPAEDDIKYNYVNKLIEEISVAGEKFGTDFSGFHVRTIYIGGGTPSVIHEDYINSIICKLKEYFSYFGEKNEEASRYSYVNLNQNSSGENNSYVNQICNIDLKNNGQRDEEKRNPEYLYTDRRRGDFEKQEQEITIEVNPGTVTREKLIAYKTAGINRLSIGLQSANDEELRILGRIHTYEEFLECYQMAREEGFQNINVDIMTALPGQTLDSLKDTLCKLIKLHPEHISAYSLILEEGTPFFEKYANPDGEGMEIKGNSSKELYEEEKNRKVYITNEIDKLRLPGEEEERAMYALVRDTLEAAGYRQYEISNFALPGYESRHNTSYWKRISYLGFGLGASSFIGDRRFRNTEDLDTYLKNGKTKDCFVENIQISEKDAMEETMFLGLRMTDGVDKKAFRETFGADIDTVYNKEIKKLLADGLIENGEERIRLTRRGVDYGNYVFSRFLL